MPVMIRAGTRGLCLVRTGAGWRVRFGHQHESVRVSDVTSLEWVSFYMASFGRVGLDSCIPNSFNPLYFDETLTDN